ARMRGSASRASTSNPARASSSRPWGASPSATAAARRSCTPFAFTSRSAASNVGGRGGRSDTRSAHPASRRYPALDAEHREGVAVADGEHHALAREAEELARGEVGHDDHAAADHRLGRVTLADAGEDLPRLRLSEIDLEAEELVALGHGLGRADQAEAEVDLGEVVQGEVAALRL